MQITHLLNVAIGLMFVFLLLSLIATAAQETIATWMQKRGTELQKGLRALLVGDKTDAQLAEQGANLFETVWDHPLVTNGTPERSPSYVAAENFSSALISVLTQGAQAPAVAQVVDGAKALPEGPVRDALVALAQKAGTDIDKMRSEIAAWFDGAMDRISGSYKRWTHNMTLTVGITMAVVLNVNTIDITFALWSDPKAANEMADYVVRNADQFSSLPSPAGQATKPQANPSAGAPAASGDRAQKDALARATLDTLELPIGWNTSAGAISDYCAALTGWKRTEVLVPPISAQVCHAIQDNGTTGFFRSVLGWLITGLAVSLGAPFWFDLLKNVINLRGAGPKPAAADATAKGKPV